MICDGVDYELSWWGSKWREHWNPRPAPPIEREYPVRFDRVGNGQSQRRIEALFAMHSTLTRRAVIERSGLSEGSVAATLSRLCERRVIERVGLGKYQRREG